jgi:phage terminase large subunit
LSIKLSVNKKLKLLYTPKRFKVLYGGRGSGKSWGIAQALIIKAHSEPGIRILCTREIQRSISDSVHRLIADQIDRMGMSELFTVENNYITHANGSYFLFEGLHHNITKIKSMEGIKYCWIEEAEKITDKSWDTLIPTIRETNSEIWVSMNPERDDDPSYRRFISDTRDDTVIQKLNYYDNPFFPEVLKNEMEICKSTNHSKYLHIWEGEPITNYESLIYRFNRQVNEVETELKYQLGVETITGWDFGVSDDTAIITMQIHQVPKSKEYPLGFMINIVDEIIKNNKDAFYYREEYDKRGYIGVKHYCDPSGASRDSSLSSWVEKIGYNFDWDHSYSPAEMIDAANDIIHAVRINRHQCPRVYKMFTHWQYKIDRDGKVVNPPKASHDEHSHPGTAFYFAIINRFPPCRTGGRAMVS